MSNTFIGYDAQRDFMRVRNFLVETHSLTEQPLNWRLERWNYARYFITPMLASWGLGEPDMDAYREAIRLFDASTGVWENEAGQIIGVVNIEHADKQHSGWGEAFFQHHPGYAALLPEMLDFAEGRLRNREKGLLFIPIYDHDHELQDLARARGYQLDSNYTLADSVYTIGRELPQYRLPEGYRVQSLADDNDLERRRKAFGLAFNHPDPNDWPSLLSCQELQRAPDYRRELDVVAVAPDGEFVSFCIAWWDALNRIASIEPVGTVPGHRRLGLARAVVLEAIRRVAALGAQKAFVGSDLPFYLSLGFQLTYTARHWRKEF
jgi:predicted N-acetyltransferase YhbS